MDRQLRLGCVVFILLGGACSRSKEPRAAAAAEQSVTSPDASSGSAANVSEPQPAAPAAIEATAAPPVAEPIFSPPPAIDRANPLRRELASMSRTTVDNPLRRLQSEPAMAAADHLTRAEPPPPSPALLPAAPAGAAPPSGGGGASSELPRAFAASSIAGFGSPQPVAPAPSSAEFEVVDVFYGTDRQFAAAGAGGWSQTASCFWATGLSGLVTIGLSLVATARRSWLSALVAFSSVGVSLGLAYQDTHRALAVVRRTGKEGPRYVSERSPAGHVDRGVCAVTIPRQHSLGELESPSVLRLEVLEEAARHIILRRTERLADARFYELLRERVEQSPDRSLFVFVHGFNVSFEDAARRTAQIHYDLKFPGAPVFFSWPAHDKFVLTYAADENNVAWSAPHLKQFLLEIVKESQARSIHLIAHSMGSRALAAALRDIEAEMRDERRLFNQVVLAAPDIDADEFRQQIAPAMRRTAQRLTLYASSRDDALLASQLIHRGPRAGDAGEGLVVLDGVDTIDVTAIDNSPWGHTYFGSNNPVLQDLGALLSQAIPPGQRAWLSPAQRAGLTYWIFQPTRTASGARESPR
jgi:esterase/lipase superfamily enzyme